MYQKNTYTLLILVDLLAIGGSFNYNAYLGNGVRDMQELQSRDLQ